MDILKSKSEVKERLSKEKIGPFIYYDFKVMVLLNINVLVTGA